MMQLAVGKGEKDQTTHKRRKENGDVSILRTALTRTSEFPPLPHPSMTMGLRVASLVQGSTNHGSGATSITPQDFIQPKITSNIFSKPLSWRVNMCSSVHCT